MAGGCATTDQRLQKLQAENRALTENVANQHQAIVELGIEKKHLEGEVAYFTKRSEVLDQEKRIRERESHALRAGVRAFTDETIRSLEDSYRKIVPADYVGCEILRRRNIDSAGNVLLVDLQNSLPADGPLIAGRAYLLAPATIQFCLLRARADKGDLSIVWISEPLTANAAGARRWEFAIPAVAQKGDFIGVYAPDLSQIPFDDADTGRTMPAPGKIKLNGTVPLKPPDGRDRRAYSFGCEGYLGGE